MPMKKKDDGVNSCCCFLKFAIIAGSCCLLVIAPMLNREPRLLYTLICTRTNGVYREYYGPKPRNAGVGAGGYGCGCDVCRCRRVGIVISSGCRSFRWLPNRQLQCDPIFVLCGRLTGPLESCFAGFGVPGSSPCEYTGYGSSGSLKPGCHFSRSKTPARRSWWVAAGPCRTRALQHAPFMPFTLLQLLPDVFFVCSCWHPT